MIDAISDLVFLGVVPLGIAVWWELRQIRKIVSNHQFGLTVFYKEE